MYSIPQSASSIHVNQNASVVPESAWSWEREEKARNAIESGYLGWERHSSRPGRREAGQDQYSKIIEASWGVDESAYEASVGGEFSNDENSARKFNKRSAGAEKSKQHLSSKQFVDLYSAVSYANHLGIVMNVHVSITWKLLGIQSHREAANVLRYEFFKHLQEWCKHRISGNHPFVWLYVHEEGRKHGFHTHLLTAIPNELRGEFRKWMAKRMLKLSRNGHMPKEAFKIVAPPSDKIGRQWRYLQYLCKGIGNSARVASSVGIEPSINAESLIRMPGGRPANVQCRKRCGISNNIGARARQSAQYESLLEQGVTDVRQLYAGKEYLSYLRNHPDTPCGDVMPMLLENETIARGINEIDAANAVVDAERRKQRKADLAYQRKVARRLEHQHKEQVARLLELFRC